MSAGRALLTRVRRLEQVRATVLSPFERAYGSLDAWEAECRAGIDAGLLDELDVPVVMLAVRRWHYDGVFRR